MIIDDTTVYAGIVSIAAFMGYIVRFLLVKTTDVIEKNTSAVVALTTIVGTCPKKVT